MSHLKEIVIPENASRKVGVVTSDRRDKSCKVEIQFSVKHPKYGKFIRRRSLIQAHDANNEAKLGDKVEIAECRPISKTKSWVVTRIVEAAVV
ncbi:MAG: 30S ribosomal protein S17 [Phycisphaerae bacterium]|jgi:small subunit ribosomal protein S17|nr:30S ribosomal protein S17 [Phycisphaerae bacterium]MBT6165229.1 30S ribosomal protein S17 [Phycisphaerae bacterium]MBT7657955.1 30S ribosomal protein S17 [Phycisphaerae bacterium]|tara:strand:+ start:245 stop:523 length:279 start_codon:yes stop_codon:yes gene_type:complete